jgi:uncharacterized protein (TIGR02453 family)
MFPQEVTTFLHDLSNHNSKAWMDANRPRYEKLKQDFFELVQAILFMMAEFEPDYAYLDPKQCIFRINRDTRFAKDKSPYKTYMSAAFSRHGRKTEEPGYYFHIDEFGVLRVDGGLYNPERKNLELVRESIYRNPNKILEIIETKEFKDNFGGLINDKLKKNPRGFETDEETMALLKYKSFVGQHEVDVRKVAEKDLPKYIVGKFKLLHPLVMYLERALVLKKA